MPSRIDCYKDEIFFSLAGTFWFDEGKTGRKRLVSGLHTAHSIPGARIMVAADFIGTLALGDREMAAAMDQREPLHL